MIGDEHDPFPDHIGLEVAPSGPYAVLERPWTCGSVPRSPRPLTLYWPELLLSSDYAFIGLRLTAQVRRMTGRFPVLLAYGEVYLRGFDTDGQMLWSGKVDRISPLDMTGSSRGRWSITVDLLPPMEFREHVAVPT